jgi:hypothetical protein
MRQYICQCEEMAILLKYIEKKLSTMKLLIEENTMTNQLYWKETISILIEEKKRKYVSEAILLVV